MLKYAMGGQIHAKWPKLGQIIFEHGVAPSDAKGERSPAPTEWRLVMPRLRFLNLM